MKTSSNPDLVIVSGVALVGVLGAAGEITPTLRFLAVAPLAVYLPGHCAAALVLGPRLPWPERVMAAFGFNLAITVLVGWGLGTVNQLDAVSWACSLAVVSCLSCLASNAWPDWAGPQARKKASSWPTALGWAGLVASAIMAIGVIGLDRRWAVARADATTFSELWMSRVPGRMAVNVALRSDERDQTTFSVTVSEPDSPPTTFFPVVLEPGATWRTTVPVSGGAEARVDASAARLRGSHAEPYRHVEVRFRNDDLSPAR